jgi:hypothetical protein
MAQLAFINDLYNQLAVRYAERLKPETVREACELIDALRNQIIFGKEDHGDEAI